MKWSYSHTTGENAGTSAKYFAIEKHLPNENTPQAEQTTFRPPHNFHLFISG